MARRTREETAATKEQILDAASHLVRERGMDGVSVAEIMAAAGLTHGGFYKHFASKEELCAAAIARASTRSTGELAKRIGSSGADFGEAYLTRAHRSNTSKGCVVAALAGEAARGATEPRAAFTAATRELLSLIE